MVVSPLLFLCFGFFGGVACTLVWLAYAIFSLADLRTTKAPDKRKDSDK
jgi:hypothetical protein